MIRPMITAPAASPLPTDAALIGRELRVGERLLWSGRPRTLGAAASFGIWIFAIPWTVFALFWEAMALMPWWAADRPDDWTLLGFGIVGPIFGIPFVVIGVGMLAMPFWAMAKAGRTIFAVTSERLIRIEAGRTRSVTSVPITGVGPIERRERPNGCGSLRIQTHSRIDSDGDRITERFDMIAIEDPARVERLILDAQRGG